MQGGRARPNLETGTPIVKSVPQRDGEPRNVSEWMPSDRVLEMRARAIRPLLDAASREHPVNAASLADAAGIRGQHETRRRRVREVIQYLRSRGVNVVGDHRGNWLGEVVPYAAKRRGVGRREFAIARDFTGAVSERNTGQLGLFSQVAVAVH
jgi:hypothetical protein